MLDIREAATLLGFRPRTLYRMAYERRVPVVKIGRAMRFRLSSLLHMIATSELPALLPLPSFSATGTRKVR